MTARGERLPAPRLEAAQIYRYLGYGRKVPDAPVLAMIDRLLPAFTAALDCRACWLELPVTAGDAQVTLAGGSVSSLHLARNLAGCSRVLLFAATIGPGADRQRMQAAVRSPAEAVILDALGTTAIESLCDALCLRWSKEYAPRGLHLRPRFSPGYGDLPLAFQSTLLGLLDSGRQAGITLTDALLMAPHKSVSALIGLGAQGCSAINHDCAACDQHSCAFRLEGN